MKKHLAFLLLIAISCSSPKKSFEKRDFQKAFKLSYRKVKKHKATSQDKDIMMESMRMILAFNRQKIDELSNGTLRKDWITALNYVHDSQDKVEKVSPFTSYNFKKIRANLREREQQLKSKIYQNYLKEGKDELELAIRRKEKIRAQTAYSLFKEAQKYNPKAEEIAPLLDKCVQYGKLVYSIQSDAPFGLRWDVDREFGNFEHESDLFLEVYYNQYVSDADCEIQLDFRDFDLDLGRRQTDKLEFQKKITTGYRTKKDTSGKTNRIPIQENVKGWVEVEELSKIANAEIYINVIANNNNCRLADNRIEDQVVNVIEKYRISGDRRAIPDKYLRRNNDELMRDEDIGRELFRQLYHDIKKYIF